MICAARCWWLARMTDVRVRRCECWLQQAGSAIRVIRLAQTAIAGPGRNQGFHRRRHSWAEAERLRGVRTGDGQWTSGPGGTSGSLSRPGLLSLLRLAYVLTGDQHAAEDLLQSALTKAAAHWGRIHGAPGGYVRRIVYREQVSGGGVPGGPR